MNKKRVGILISGRGSNMAALIAAAQAPDYPAEIVLVLSNRPQAAGLARAQEAGVPSKVIDHTVYGKDRAAFERAMQATLDAHGVEILCLAGFMRLMTPEFVTHWDGRMINVHPALLPAFKGLDTHARALAAGVRLHGATVHFVVPEMDCGAIVVQAAVPVLDGDTAETLAARVLAAEHRIFPAALRWLAEDRISRVGDRCSIAGVSAGHDVMISPTI